MSTSVRYLDQIRVASPCEAEWDSMIGNDRVRFCEHCNLHVNNLSAMTRQDALRLVAQSGGRLCVRYEQRTDGEILTTNFPKPLYRIGRRASRLAATAFSATLSLASASAQSTAPTSTRAEVVRENAKEPAKSAGDARLSCTIVDPAGAVVPDAAVTLTNDQTSVESSLTSTEDGVCIFENLAPGTYTVKTVVTGFTNSLWKDIQIQSGGNRHLQISLEVETQVAVTVGMVAVQHPIDPLPLYASRNDLNMVAQLVKLTPDIDAPDQATNISALTYAVENGNREIVHLLLAAGAYINAANKYGDTPIMHLNDMATADLVRDLISAGADVEARDQYGDTALLNAARSSPLPAVQQLMAAGARADAKDDQGNTLLLKAAQNDDPAVLKFLLASGLDATSKNNDGQSAITLAAHSGMSKNIQALLDAGATFDLEQQELDELLMQNVNGADLDTIRLLLKAGASPNAKEDDETALMRATEYGKPEALKILIDAGADLNATDDDGWTALMYANDVDKIKILIDAGADMKVKSKDGKTALALAIENQQEEVATFLKSRGAPK
jgi:ankyrin repeat protein